MLHESKTAIIYGGGGTPLAEMSLEVFERPIRNAVRAIGGSRSPSAPSTSSAASWPPS